MGKTGGGIGTNQYQVRGASSASRPQVPTAYLLRQARSAGGALTRLRNIPKLLEANPELSDHELHMIYMRTGEKDVGAFAALAAHPRLPDQLVQRLVEEHPTPNVLLALSKRRMMGPDTAAVVFDKICERRASNSTNGVLIQARVQMISNPAVSDELIYQSIIKRQILSSGDLIPALQRPALRDRLVHHYESKLRVPSGDMALALITTGRVPDYIAKAFLDPGRSFPYGVPLCTLQRYPNFADLALNHPSPSVRRAAIQSTNNTDTLWRLLTHGRAEGWQLVGDALVDNIAANRHCTPEMVDYVVDYARGFGYGAAMQIAASNVFTRQHLNKCCTIIEELPADSPDRVGAATSLIRTLFSTRAKPPEDVGNYDIRRMWHWFDKKPTAAAHEVGGALVRNANTPSDVLQGIYETCSGSLDHWMREGLLAHSNTPDQIKVILALTA